MPSDVTVAWRVGEVDKEGTARGSCRAAHFARCACSPRPGAPDPPGESSSWCVTPASCHRALLILRSLTAGQVLNGVCNKLWASGSGSGFCSPLPGLGGAPLSRSFSRSQPPFLYNETVELALAVSSEELHVKIFAILLSATRCEVL